MIEKLLIEFLSGRTEAAQSVFAERPEEIPLKYLLIEKIGGGKENHIKNSLVAVKSIADSMQGGTMLDVIRLNEEVKSVMDSLVALDEVTACELDSDYNNTDPETKEYRYQAVFEITHY